MDRSRLFRIAILPLAALLAAGGTWYFAAHKSFQWPFKHKSSSASPTTNVLPSDHAVAPPANSTAPSATSPAPALSISASAIGDIQFISPEAIGTINFDDKSDDDETDTRY